MGSWASICLLGFLEVKKDRKCYDVKKLCYLDNRFFHWEETSIFVFLFPDPTYLNKDWRVILVKWSLLSIKWNHLNSSSLTPSSKDSCPLYVELPTLPFLKQLSYEYKHISVAASLILPYQFAYLTNTCTGYVLVKKKSPW